VTYITHQAAVYIEKAITRNTGSFVRRPPNWGGRIETIDRLPKLMLRLAIPTSKKAKSKEVIHFTQSLEEH
jgi:hypothetical protein